MVSWLVVSDVDHTLLEHPGQASQAGESLRRLWRRGVPTLLASSKTFAEMVALQSAAGLPPQPFLFENGCGIGWPGEPPPAAAAAGAPRRRRDGYGAFLLGGDGEAAAALLRRLRAEGGLRFSLLAELPVAAIRDRLGLEEPLARLALERLATVPLLWQDDEAGLERLRRGLAPHGLGAVHGGRLVHVGPPLDKRQGLQRLLAWRDAAAGPEGATGERRHAEPPRILACGDSENDRGLLEDADLALVFQAAGRPPLALGPRPGGRPRRERSVGAGGPARWLEAVEQALASAADGWVDAAAVGADRRADR